ncbi:glycosyltransferase family 39 protein [Candidatus Daviesbacteria bacterium]|nr:glycosyltransferase family 39 protein [Candidatus Daviesbacteria bacterium]
MNKLKYVILPLIILNILLASRWILDGNIFFHTDIARDFLLMEDIVDNKHLTLIGPRSGAIPGLFHGPLWLYLNIPAFLIGNGNPVFVGWFWVVLYILSLFIIYYVGKKMFGAEKGIFSALLLSSVTILYVRSLFNPYGALLLSPLYFYTFVQYLRSKKMKTLILSLFLLGLIIQFQMAFGIPILVLTSFYLIYDLYKNKKLSHLVALFVLIVPLSSFLLFDLRNNFLQLNSIANYLWGSQTHGKLDLNLTQVMAMRVRESVTDGLGIITQNNIYITVLLLLSIIFVIFHILRQKDQKNRLVYFLFSYFYLGFWLMTTLFKGPVWNYYYIPFIPLLILMIVSLKREMNKFIFYTIFILIYVLNLQNGLKDMSTYNPNPLEQDVSTWKFNKLVADKVFAGEEKEFGYFIFTPDLYGYSPRYALDFYQKRTKDKKAYPYQKKGITYLIIAPPPEYGKDPNSIWYQRNTNSKLWKNNDIRIAGDPVSKVSFKNGFEIEKYYLSSEEIKVESNPYLIKDIFFR